MLYALPSNASCPHILLGLDCTDKKYDYSVHSDKPLLLLVFFFFFFFKKKNYSLVCELPCLQQLE
jgi:hypothetical protein